MIGWLCAAGAAAACALAAPTVAVPRGASGPGPPTQEPAPDGWLLRHRRLWSVLAGIGAAVFVGGEVGLGLGVAAAVAVHVTIGRAEPPGVRRHREAVRRDLPHVVSLLAAGLTAGAAPGAAVRVVCQALPGAAADELGAVAARLDLGADPAAVWSGLGRHPDLAPLGRAVGRSYATGAPVVAAVDRLADEMAGAARAEVEDRARAVGVKAAVPLGLCLLPAFVLIGIVPLVAGLMSTLEW